MLVEPTLELPHGDKPAASSTYNTEFGEDVLVKEVTADAERGGGFGWGEGEPGCAGRALGWTGHAVPAATSEGFDGWSSRPSASNSDDG